MLNSQLEILVKDNVNSLENFLENLSMLKLDVLNKHVLATAFVLFLFD